jgi:MtrB/PioB family decaheme-associated outer membrane protein
MTNRHTPVSLIGKYGALLLLCLRFTLASAEAATPQQPPMGIDTSHWLCKYCPFEQGSSRTLDIGLGMTSDHSFKFGEYNGLHDNGAFLILNGDARYRDADAGYLNLRLRNLGLDTRSVEMEGGRQGSYRLFLDYHEISHYLSDTARTPYRGNGGDSLSLPASWVHAGSTAGMTQLGSSLHDVELDTRRKRLGIGVDLIPSNHWQTSLQVRHEVRDGQRPIAGSFFFNAAQLVAPVDYVTNEIEASVSYTRREWQSRLAYYGSFFSNHDTALSWQNAYNPLVAGADSGQLALPPSNRFHQVQLSSAYQLSADTHIHGDIAIGRMEQDEDLLPATGNASLATTLPRQSAQAKIDTLTANLKLNSRISNKLRLDAAYRYNDRDNKTPSALFNWVTTDTYAAVARRNLPYSFTDQSLHLAGYYRLARATRVSAGYQHAKKDRTHQEVDKTTENTYWGKFSLRIRDNIDFSFKAAHADRNASDFNPVSDVVPAENPLLRKYNMADRRRNSGSAHIGINSNKRLSIGLGIDVSNDDYSNSALGLTESRDSGYNVDVSLLLSEATSLHTYVSRERIKSEQAGSQAFASADWSASNEDTSNTFGIGVKHRLIKDKLDIGADYLLSTSSGKISVRTGTPDAAFPTLKSNLATLKLHADYRLQENLALHAGYWYENYHANDWALDGVDPDTISNVLGFGNDSPDYDLHLVMMSMRYRF